MPFETYQPFEYLSCMVFKLRTAIQTYLRLLSSWQEEVPLAVTLLQGH